MKLEWNLDLGIKTLDAQRRGRGWVILPSAMRVMRARGAHAAEG